MLRLACFAIRAPFVRRLASSTASILPQLPIPMPKLSPSMLGGRIVKWHVQEGDTIAVDQLLFDLETDTLTEAGGRMRMQIESQEEGVLAKVFVEAAAACGDAADTIAVNSVVAVLSDSHDTSAAQSVAAAADAQWGTRVPTSACFDATLVGPAASAPAAIGSRRVGGFAWQAYAVPNTDAATQAAGCCMK